MKIIGVIVNILAWGIVVIAGIAIIYISIIGALKKRKEEQRKTIKS